MSALGDFFQGAYAWSEQERIRQVEEDNKFKLYEKQQRLVNALADEDKKTEVSYSEPHPEVGEIWHFNAYGTKIGSSPMDKIALQTAQTGLVEKQNAVAKSGLELSLEGQYGAREREADLGYKRALTNAANAQGEYYRTAGKRGSEEGGALGLTAADGSALDKKITDTIVGLENELASPLSDEERMAFEEILKIAPDRNRGLSLVNSVRAQILQDRKDAQKKLEREQASKLK